MERSSKTVAGSREQAGDKKRSYVLISAACRLLPATVFIVVPFLVLLLTSPVHACRFWAAVGPNVSEEITTTQLLIQNQSLKKLGSEYRDGWSVGYYTEDGPVIFRGVLAADVDGDFDDAVRNIAAEESSIAFSHLRRASSGCVEGVPNPHPFVRSINGKTWVFGHNGGMKKQILISQIGEKYLKANAPTTCTDNPPDTWIDSELYFIFLLKKIEDNKGNVTRALRDGLVDLYMAIEEENRYLNFFLSDGQTLWAFRKGNTLFWKYEKQEQVSLISSTIPDFNDSAWKAVNKENIVVIKKDADPEFIPLFDEVRIKKR